LAKHTRPEETIANPMAYTLDLRARCNNRSYMTYSTYIRAVRYNHATPK